MKSWKGQSRGTILGYKIFVWGLRKIGLGFAYAMLTLVATYFFFFTPRSFAIVYSYFRKRIKRSFLGSVAGVFQNYYRLGQVLIDKVAIMGGLNDEFDFDFEGREKLQSYISAQKGAIIISGHVGNWDAASYFLREFQDPTTKVKVNVLMFDGEHEHIKEYMDEVMVDKTVTIIPVKPDLSHLIPMHKALKAGEIVCMHGDRYIETSQTITVSFFGAPAKFPKGPFHIASKYKIPVGFVLAIKDGKTHYKFLAHSFSDPELSLEEIAQRYADWLEEQVKKYPTQWFNFYRFWEE